MKRATTTVRPGVGTSVVQRRVGGRWRDAGTAVFGTRYPAVVRLGLSVRPGRVGAGRRDRIALPSDLAPGLYRVFRQARDPVTGSEPGVRRTTTKLGRVSRRRSIDRYVNACPTRSIYDR